MNLADKIISLRKQKGWSQEELAAQMDVSRQSVSKWESGASTPDLDKILLLSKIFGISTDYLLKDDEEISSDTGASTEKETPKRFVSKEEARNFISTQKQAAKKIALGVWLCIMSPVTLLVLLGLSQKPYQYLSENMAVLGGLCVLFVLVTIAVACFIVTGMTLSKYEYLKKEEILLDAEMEKEVLEESEFFLPGFARNIAIGVGMCIISVIPVVTCGVLEKEVLSVMAVGLLLVIVACAVFLFVSSGMKKSAYDQLLQRENYTVERKEANQEVEKWAGVYWCIVTAIYLGVSFVFNCWRISWAIWPVTGVLYGAVTIIAENKLRKK